MGTEWIGPLVGGLGLGSILTSLVQGIISKKTEQRKYALNEKKEAYVGLLSAYRDLAISHSSEKAKEFAYWRARLTLVGSPEVINAVDEIMESGSGSPERSSAQHNLFKTMRDDLGVDKRELSTHK
ncbi:MAG: hypothetical protein LDL07_14115 [Desulfarculus sp.]|nr:hypothetical protein [Desulfarculus sp.]